MPDRSAHMVVLKRDGGSPSPGRQLASENGEVKALNDSQEPSARICRPPDNCWRLSSADRAALLVDGAAYFSALDKALDNAAKRIWIIGWDFDPEITLRPDQPDAVSLGSRLRRLVETREGLEIRLLVWALGPIYSSKSLHLFTHHPWADHPRIFLRFDRRQPLRGAQHQKIVCIDDTLAFVGGIDLTSGRWDMSAHEAHSAVRLKPNGDSYGPVHDLQAAFSGPAARDVAELAETRWKDAIGEAPPPVERSPAFWPAGVEPLFESCRIALARTVPRLVGRAAHHEAINLTLDAIAASRRHVYIETQYFASFRVGRAIAEKLQEPDGPEILVIATQSSRGIIEQFMMAHNRDRLIRRLKRHDPNGRLRVMYAVVPDETAGDQSGDGGGSAELEVLIHSKVIVIDDRFVRVGSSNLNNRSEGLDTECDVAVEADHQGHRTAIAGFRNRLLAEHLGSDAQSVERAIADTGSLLKAVDRLNVKPRGLRGYDVGIEKGGITPLPATGLLDPRQPYWPLQRLIDGLRRLFGGSGRGR
ncbi:phospholipase D-like domain-containing protein [Fodinicurvata sp. EGI_FJ10296]|uniref:phospholipase D-like domain-containing protein n=1 Tax=Fodinicurvata sp. EGI_FJ10296 TaxID=3231908 RepID=UPI0034514B6A